MRDTCTTRAYVMLKMPLEQVKTEGHADDGGDDDDFSNHLLR